MPVRRYGFKVFGHAVKYASIGFPGVSTQTRSSKMPTHSGQLIVQHDFASAEVRMKYGVILPNVGPMAEIDALTDVAQRAEEMGFDGIFLSDHIALPTDLRSRYPYRSDGRFALSVGDPILEPVTTLAYLAALTERVDLGFSVLVLPYRHPVLNAKMLGTLDVISRGRLIVGAGRGVDGRRVCCSGRRFCGARFRDRRAYRNAARILDRAHPELLGTALQRVRTSHDATPDPPAAPANLDGWHFRPPLSVVPPAWETAGTVSVNHRQKWTKWPGGSCGCARTPDCPLMGSNSP